MLALCAEPSEALSVPRDRPNLGSVVEPVDPCNDTDPAAGAAQAAAWRAMTPMAKYAALQALQATAVAFAEAGIRARHPRAGPREVFLRRIAQHLDRATMMAVYGYDPGSS